MKTLVFKFLLKKLAKSALPEAEYNAFAARYDFMRWNQLRQNFPELWDRFSDKFNEIKDQVSRSSDPQDVAEMVIPGNIEHYPELFEPFRLQIEQLRLKSSPDVDLVTATHGGDTDIVTSDLDTDAISNAASSIQVSLPSGEGVPVDEDTVRNFFAWIVEFLHDLFR